MRPSKPNQVAGLQWLHTRDSFPFRGFQEACQYHRLPGGGAVTEPPRVLMATLPLAAAFLE